ncbi:pullulanase-type alpha-1,6-glucosidase [uncultured Cellulomonas sp.]|uniref:pullulanase-type alpha-1,6-glucosidase n=1 Tax=uncultured Cellulomonas sp. TaxID=189682 RepID=UPI00260E5BB4|nr:pullulanase-type alpha-1,6-glucosidase [uncultured Cellulomonas sp.]
MTADHVDGDVADVGETPMRSWPNRHRRTSALTAALALVAVGIPTAAQADHVPTPGSVTLVGDLQSELGCPGDWQPECAATHLADADGDGVWSATFEVPVGTWALKVALDDSWDVNFGANGAQGGADIALTVETAGAVTFSYDHATHGVTADGEGLAGPALTEARAHWLTEDLIAWDVTDPAATYTLHLSPDGLELGEDGVTGGVEQPLTWVGDSLPPELAQRWPHLADLALLRVPDAVAARTALLGALAVSAEVDGAFVDATGLQVPGVLDDLYAADARDAELGVSWDDAGVPTLRLWAPTARSVTLHLFDDPDAPPPGQTVPMTLDVGTGIWTVVGAPGWDRRFYLYEVEVFVPSTGQVEHNVVTDPYSVSLAANSTKSQVVDLSDPDLEPAGWDAVGTQAPPTPERIDLYELHVRDFSIGDESVPAEHRGTYLAFTHPETDGMQHLRALRAAGLTTVHLLPTFDIASIEEVRAEQAEPQIPQAAPDSPAQGEAVLEVAADDAFNWGYDPWHYNAPEGSYATDPDGARRILEYRQMVQGLNGAGLGVVNDVVYNHTAAAGQADRSVLDRIVPGYYHRLLEEGSVATSTCCPNTATEHAMMEKLMVDSVVLWATQYKVDGFRFDLMGHHSRDSMLAVRAALDALTPQDDGVDGSQVYVYGEGWNFGEVADDARFVQATQANMAGTGIGTFSDRLRDAVRGGGPFDEDPRVQGFGSGLLTDPNGAAVNGDAAAQRAALLLAMDQIRVGLAGNLAAYTFTGRTGETVTGAQVPYNGQPAGYTADPQENVLYVSAHDNETLYDSNAFKLPPGTSMADRVRMQQLALSTVALGQGVSFFHAGSDILRSKSLDRNSYDSGDWFNALDWSLQSNNFGVGLPPAPDNEAKWPFMQPLLADPALVPTPTDIAASAARFRDLLAVADSSPLFSLTTAQQVQAKVRFHNTGPDQVPGVIAMHLDDTAGVDVDPALDGVLVVFNASDEPVSLTLDELTGHAFALSPALADGADDVVRGTTWDPASGTVTVPARTTAALVEAAPRAPQRILDVAAVTPGTVHCVGVAGEHGVPSGAAGVVVNVTAVAPSGPGYAVVFPDRRGGGTTPMPATSTVNFEPGRDVANSTFVPLPADGDLCYATQGAAEVRLLVDLTAVVAADSGVVLTHPARLLDTRPLGVGEIDGPVPGRSVRTIQVAGVGGVPADARSVMLNVTVAGATELGNLRVFPGGAPVPDTSVLNYAPGVDRANATVVELADDGTISLWSDTTAPVHVILDVLGHTAPGSAYTPVSPTRVVDTRAGTQVGALTGPLAARHVHTLPVAGAASTGVPAGATAVVLNVTAIDPTTAGNLRVYPGAGAPPSASAINYVVGRDIPNLTVVPLGPDGRVSFWSDQEGGAVDLAVDVLGYLAP